MEVNENNKCVLEITFADVSNVTAPDSVTLEIVFSDVWQQEE